MGSNKLAKQTLRQELLQRRDAIPPATRLALSAAIADRVLRSQPCQTAAIVAVYLSMRSEVLTEAIIAAVWAQGQVVVVPQVDWVARRLEAVEYRPDDPIELGRFGVPEVQAEPSRRRPATAIDLLLAPGVGFDRSCRRLGYGGGFYDRLLPMLRPETVVWGLAFSAQVVDELPVEEHDRQLDSVVTEHGWVTAGGG